MFHKKFCFLDVCRPIIIFSTIFSSFFCMGMSPLENESQIQSLVGIDRVQVIVNIGLSIEGPTKRKLQEAVELQLREEGVQIHQDIDGEVSSSIPVFNVEVGVWQNTRNTYTYFINANFFQPVQLIQNKQIMPQAITWQSKIIGSGTLDRIHKDVTKSSRNFVLNIKKAKRQYADIQ